MIRVSKHNISKFSNAGKLYSLDKLFIDYKLTLLFYINQIADGNLALRKQLSSKDLPSIGIEHSRYKQLIYKQASEIIRSQIDKVSEKRFNNYKKIYKYFKDNGRQLNFVNKKYNELNLNNLLFTKYFTKPNVSTLTITLDERFFDIKNGEHFDNFVKIILPDFNEKGTRALQINVPLKQHKQSNKIKDGGFTMRKAIQLKKVNGKYYIHLIWEKETKLKDDGKAIGFDLGYKKLIATSDNQFIGEELNDLYQKIYNKEQNSKAYRRLLTHRDNLINYYVNQVNTDNLKEIVIEDLNNVKYKSEFNNKTNNLLSRWSYRKTIDKIERICEVKGIKLVKVSPSYTSQTCSMCGAVHEESRSGENYKCIDCGFEIDADYNASINILRRGVYSPSNHQKAKC